MELTSTSFSPGRQLPDHLAFAMPDAETTVTFSGNRNPHLGWSGVPDGTRSFVLLCVDADGPTIPDDVNQHDREVPPGLPRADFIHWVVVDLPPGIREIEEGEFSDGVVPGGRSAAMGPQGCRQGVNDYTSWFAGDPEMEGTYLGYDGPGPPWNDSLVHNYAFTIYAIDMARLPVAGGFAASEVKSAMEGHILGKASVSGLYTLNARLR